MGKDAHKLRDARHESLWRLRPGTRFPVLPAGSETTASVRSLPCPRAPGGEAVNEIPAPHGLAQKRSIHHVTGGGVEHRQRLLASVQVTSYNSHAASFGPSAVRVNAATVYSARREADLVMSSTEHVWRQFRNTKSCLGCSTGFLCSFACAYFQLRRPVR